MDQATQATDQVGQSAWQVFEAWAFTRTGALLLIIVIFAGGASMVMSLLGRAVRGLSIAAGVAAGIFFLWVIGGILEAYGVPVREIVSRLAGLLPGLAEAAVNFVISLFQAAS